MDIEKQLLSSKAKEHWMHIGVKQHHGICFPLFSIHSRKSCGIGEYLDLIPMIEWCHQIGFDVIQLLPLNDTGLGTSPYDALSAHALNPIHLSLTALPELNRIIGHQDKLKKIAYWSRTPRVKHHIVRELKNVFLKEYVPHTFAHIAASQEYKTFIEQNSDWLTPYALFKALKEKQYWKSWEQWPAEIKNPSKSHYEELLETHTDAINFHKLLQFLCFSQFEQAKAKASELGILIKGDIPILIARDSADVWRHRDLFNLDLAAGAPPDAYTRDGQHWGFPLYNWEALAKTDYAWWKRRLNLASNLYHIYRIDHVVGFFRMWGIPKGKKPAEGTFFPTDENSWLPHGTKLMNMMLQAAPIFPIGEDLGLVPQEVKQTLYNLGICGTKMMRWERYNEGKGDFIPPSDYEPMSMSTVSTHDSDTLGLWWRHFPKEAKLYSEFKKWPYEPFLSPEKNKQILHESHHTASLFHINLLQEYLALFPQYVSKNPSDERINIPGKVLDTNWTYRFVPTIEQLTEDITLIHTMKEMLC